MHDTVEDQIYEEGQQEADDAVGDIREFHSAGIRYPLSDLDREDQDDDDGEDVEEGDRDRPVFLYKIGDDRLYDCQHQKTDDPDDQQMHELVVGDPETPDEEISEEIVEIGDILDKEP